MRIILSAFLAFVCGLFGTFRSAGVQAQMPSCRVTTSSGEVQGANRGSSCAFLGIPFAAPPTGPLRWKPPISPVTWAGLLNATTAPLSCPLINLAGVPSGSEDCLKLNIWVPNPQPSTPAPVIVWFHTGSFVSASANFAGSNGQSLAEHTGAIIVAPNYRLGPFGFLAHQGLSTEDAGNPSSGNYGLLDQRAALLWVRTQVAAFGGDPERVTIAGTSAGGHSVGLHLVSPGSAGLFDRAIMQSGYATTRLETRSEGEAKGVQFAAALGCTDAALAVSCMRSRSREQILLALPLGTFEWHERPVHWDPIVDGVVVPEQPRTLFETGAFSRVPVIVGVNGDEGWTWVDRSFPTGLSADAFEEAVRNEFGSDASAVLSEYPLSSYGSPKDALAQLAGDAEYVCEARRASRLIERSGARVFLFSFEYAVGAVAGGRAIHGLESYFVFGNNLGPPLVSSYVLSGADLELSRSMAGYWTRFAAAGHPNTDDPGVIHWPAFTHPVGQGRGADKYLVFDTTIHEAHRPREARCNFWEGLFLRTISGAVPAWEP